MNKIDNDFQFRIQKDGKRQVGTSANSTFLKAMAAVTAAVMLSLILLAGIFIVMEADHECEGEDCHVCQCLEQCQATLNRIGSVSAAGKAVLFFALLLITSTVHVVRVIRRQTPVSIKVRLND